MESKLYEVEVVYRQRAVYHVHAPDRDTAERLAEERWQQGEPCIVPGYEWGELESVRAVPARDEQGCKQDAELVLRFLRERERLLQRLGQDPRQAGMGAAISAAQVAHDLGWTRRSAEGHSVADLARATVALERLCREHRIVCFRRPRSRQGERGEIRLYCTPEHTDQLSSAAGAA